MILLYDKILLVLLLYCCIIGMQNKSTKHVFCVVFDSTPCLPALPFFQKKLRVSRFAFPCSLFLFTPSFFFSRRMGKNKCVYFALYIVGQFYPALSFGGRLNYAINWDVRQEDGEHGGNRTPTVIYRRKHSDIGECAVCCTSQHRILPSSGQAHLDHNTYTHDTTL